MHRLAPLLLLAACTPTPEPHAFTPLPDAVTPLTVCWIDTGGITVPGGYGAGGSSETKNWEVTSAAILVRHPRGDLLIDSGISPDAPAEAKDLGAWRRFVFSQTAGRNVMRRKLADTLAVLGAKPIAVILSHAHPDHAGGIGSLVDVPVWLSAEEKKFIETDTRGVVLPAHAKLMKERMVPLTFEAAPFANYDARADVFGDGSIVVVPTFGHTPGSVATFVNAPGARFVHVGDLINLGESIRRKTGKSWVMRKLTDEDEAATEAQVAKLVELQQQDPELVILAAHDRPAFVKLFGEDTGELPPCIGPGTDPSSP